jgi:hypothetical protein
MQAHILKNTIFKTMLFFGLINTCFGKSNNYYHATIQPALSLEYKIPSKSTLEIANFFFWEIKATCSLKIEDPEATISAKITEKYGVVNDITLNKGDIHDFLLHNDDKLFITAPSGSAVALFNYSDHTILAKCSAA